VVLIAGKGHEVTQEQDGRSVPFDDRLVAEEVLSCSR
jgi:UDP-N-acetylmuramyl tripeptide synthase